MNFKVTMLMQQGTGIAAGDPTATNEHIGGWSESLYLTATDPGQALSVVRFGAVSFPSILSQRALLLANSGIVIGFRIQQVMPKSGRAQTGVVNYNGIAGPTDVPQMALLVTMGAINALNIRHFSIRGIPDAMVVNGEYSPSASFTSALASYFANLGTNYSFVGQDLTQALADIVTIKAATGVLTTTANMGSWTVGDTIQIFKTKFDVTAQSVSFKAKILTVNTLTNFNITPAPLLDCSGGTARKVLPVVLNMDGNGQVSRVGVRKVGRPFGQYVGRRSKKRRVT